MSFGGSSGGNVRDPSGITIRSPGLTVDSQRSRRNSDDIFFTGNVTRTPGGLADLSAQRIPELVGLTTERLGQFVPGEGALTQRARDAGQRATGNLRDTLGRRRVLGSSFGNASLVQAELEASRAISDAQLQELAVEQTIIQQQSQLLAAGVNQVLAEAGLAAGTTTNLAQLFTQADSLEAQLESQASGGLGAGLGQLVGTLGGAALGNFGDIFGAAAAGGLGVGAGGNFLGGRPISQNSLAFLTGA